jgi:hypothetical protein
MQRHTRSRIFALLALPALATPACVEMDEAEPVDETEVDVETNVEPDIAALAYATPTVPYAPADYDGDGTADQGWYSGNGYFKIDTDDDEKFDQTVRHLPSGDIRFIAPADYDGDGRADIAFKDRLGVWSIDYAANGFSNTWDASFSGYGATSLPVPADYDGDGRDDLSVKDSGGTWYINYASNGFASGWDASWGGYGPDSAVPVPADYDGDGRADLSVKDSYGYWHINYASNGFASGWDYSTSGYGGSTARPAPADYDGDGRADLSVKDSTGYWHINYASNGFPAGWDAQFPGYGVYSYPVPADYDGDGRADLSIVIPDEYWFVDLAAGGFGAFNWFDRMKEPAAPTISLEEATTTSLRVRFQGDALTDVLWSVRHPDASTWRSVDGRTDTRTFSGLAAGTEYCFGAQAVNGEGATDTDRCFTTKTPPQTSGTSSMTMTLDPVVGPVHFYGSWGPQSGKIATRLWRADAWTPSILWFLKPGRSWTECWGPDHYEATIPLIDGGSLSADQIAELQGLVLPPGNQYNFLACYSEDDGDVDFPNTVSVNVDWQLVD